MVCTVVVAVATELISVAQVQAGIAATGTWQGTVTLDTWPCPFASCVGNFIGALSGTATGLDGSGHPFRVIWPDPTNTVALLNPPILNLAASFQYNDDCPIGATGNAGGGFTLSGGYVDDNGAVAHDGAMTGTFAWDRVGAVVHVSTANGTITGGGKTLATQQTIGEGAGVFAPLSIPSTCFAVGPLTAQIAGGYGTAQ